MTDDIANLGFSIDSTQAVQASQNLDQLARSAQATEDRVNSLAQQNAGLTRNLDLMTQQLVAQRAQIDDLTAKIGGMASATDRLGQSVSAFHQQSAQMATTVSWWGRLGDAIAYVVEQGNRLGNMMQPTVLGGAIGNMYGGWPGLIPSNFGEAQLTPDFWTRMNGINQFAAGMPGGTVSVGADPLAYARFMASTNGNGLTDQSNQQIFAHLQQMMYDPMGAQARELAQKLGINISSYSNPRDLFGAINDTLNGLSNPRLRATYAKEFFGSYDQTIDQAMRVGDNSNGTRDLSDAEKQLSALSQWMYNRQRSYNVSNVTLGTDAEKKALAQLGPMAVRYFDDLASDQRDSFFGDLGSFKFRAAGGDLRTALGGVGRQLMARYYAYAPWVSNQQETAGLQGMGLPQFQGQGPVKSFQEYEDDLQKEKDAQQNFFNWSAQREADYWNTIADAVKKGGQTTIEEQDKIEKARTAAVRAALAEREMMERKEYNFSVQQNVANGDPSENAVLRNSRLRTLYGYWRSGNIDKNGLAEMNMLQHQTDISIVPDARQGNQIIDRDTQSQVQGLDDQAASSKLIYTQLFRSGQMTNDQIVALQDALDKTKMQAQINSLTDQMNNLLRAMDQAHVDPTIIDAQRHLMQQGIQHVRTQGLLSIRQRNYDNDTANTQQAREGYYQAYGAGIEEQQAGNAVSLGNARNAFASGTGSDMDVLGAQGHQAFLSYQQALSEADHYEQTQTAQLPPGAGADAQRQNIHERAEQMRAIARANYQRDSQASNPAFVGAQNDASFTLDARRSTFLTNYMKQYNNLPSGLRDMYRKIGGQAFDINVRGVPGNLAAQSEAIRRTYGNNLLDEFSGKTSDANQTFHDNQQLIDAAGQGAAAEARITQELARQNDLRRALNDQQKDAINHEHDISDQIAQQNRDLAASREMHSNNLDEQATRYQMSLVGTGSVSSIRDRTALYRRVQGIRDAGYSPGSEKTLIDQATRDQQMKSDLDDMMKHVQDTEGIWQNTIGGVQSAMTNFFDTTYNHGSKTWVKLADSFQASMIQALSKLQTAMFVNPFMEQAFNYLDPSGHLSDAAGLSGSSSALTAAGAGPFGLLMKALFNGGGSSGATAMVPDSMALADAGASGDAVAMGLTSDMGFAKGGAWWRGTRFLSLGDIVDQPTRFTDMGGSRMNVMGEAGTEAVMPLTRGPDGSLGVRSHGSSGGGSGTIYIDARGSDAGVQARIDASLKRAAPVFQSNAVKGSVERVAHLSNQGGSFARMVGRRTS